MRFYTEVVNVSPEGLPANFIEQVAANTPTWEIPYNDVNDL
jgi:hypothetical protein